MIVFRCSSSNSDRACVGLQPQNHMHLEFKVPSLMAERPSWANSLSTSPKVPQDEDQSSGSSTPEGPGSPKVERKEIE